MLSCENLIVKCLLFAISVLLSGNLVLNARQDAGSGVAGAPTFHNPLLRSGPDPWVTYRNGFYYEMNSTGKNLTIRRTKDITDLRNAETKVVWTPPETGPYSHDIWAPELHYVQGKWYIYFAADSGTNETHRLWVLENASADPLSDGWVLKGQLTDGSNKWAIDGSVFESNAQWYVIWSGWKGNHNGEQDIYIAKLSNPWTISGKRARISRPKYDWEKIGSKRDPFVSVNEGPEVLPHGDKLYLVYSASGCWTDHYALGMLTADAGTDLLKAKSWTKSSKPLLTEAPAAHAYGPGHNGFFQSPDGTQQWIIYHANPEPHLGCKDQRSPRIQPFTWNGDGSPNFGRPVSLDQDLPKPSGSSAQ
jgi:GH43 family beta-xylosidase